jgi:hypothetical protein
VERRGATYIRGLFGAVVAGVSLNAAPSEFFNCPMTALEGFNDPASPPSVTFMALLEDRGPSFIGGLSIVCAMVVAARLPMIADFAIEECWLCLRVGRLG